MHPSANLAQETESIAHALLGGAQNQYAHLSVYFVSRIRHLELPSTPLQILFPLAIHHRRYRLDWANAGHV